MAQKTWLGAVVLLAASCASSTHRYGSPEVPFDTTGVDSLLEWSRTSSAAPPEDWRASRAYVLTREWAKWSGLPDPERDIDAILAQIRAQKITDPSQVPLHKIDQFLSTLIQRRQTFLAEAKAHLANYLPAGTEVRGQVLFAIFIPPYAFAWGDGSIIINLTASYWSYDPNKVLHLLIHELFHNGYGQYQQGTSPAQASSGEILFENILWQTQNEGLATYVGYRARPPDLFVEDYALIEDSVTSGQLFQKLRKLLARSKKATPEELPALKKEVWSVGTEGRAFYVVGASMAQRIESSLGREALVETIKKGPRHFFELYESTKPPTPVLTSEP